MMKYSGVALLLAVFLLPACSYFHSGDRVDVNNSQTIDLLDGQVAPQSPAEIFAARSGGSVQIYSLDGPAVDPTKVVEHNAGPEGYRLGENPSVEIYGFDGVANAAAPIRAPVQAATLNNTAIYFDHGSAALDSGDHEILRSVARSFDPAARKGLDIVGFSSVDSSIVNTARRQAKNFELSAKRAANVGNALVDYGVPPQAIRVTGRGEISGSEGRGNFNSNASARRVEIISE